MPFSVEQYKDKTSDELIEALKTLGEENDALKVAKPVIPAIEPTVTLSDPLKPKTEGGDKTMNEEIAKKLKEQENTIKELTEKNRLSDVREVCNRLQDSGTPSVVVTKLSELLSVNFGASTFKFSEKDKDGKVSEKLNTVADCLITLAESVPTIQLGDTITTEEPMQTATTSDHQKDVDMVKTFAETNKLSFRDAYNRMLKDGKIKAYNTKVSKE